MAEYLAPGVYVEETSFRAPSIEGVGTSTAGFAGPTLTGPVGKTPELLTSFGDFESIYGGYGSLSLAASSADLENVNYLALGVKAFFDNGGSRLYVSRVFAPKTDTDTGIADSEIAAKKAATNAAAAAKTAVKTAEDNAANAVTAAKTAADDAATAKKAAEDAAAAKITADKAVVDSPTDAPAAAAKKVADKVADETAAARVVADKAVAETAAARVVADKAAAEAAAALDVADEEVKALAAAQAAIDRRAIVQARFPGASGNQTVSVTLNAAKASKVDGLPPGSLVALVPATGTTTFYTNGTGDTFVSGATALPASPVGILYALTMQVTARGASGQQQIYSGLGFDPAHRNYLGAVLGLVPPRHIDQLENQVAFLVGKDLTPASLFAAIFGSWQPVASAPPAPPRRRDYPLAGGNDGLEPVAADYGAALKHFEALEGIAIVAAPGSSAFKKPEAIVNSLITHVSRPRAYRIAVLDTPPDQIASDDEDVRSTIDSSYAALYVPWVITPNPLARSGTATPAEVKAPPSGFVCGIYARNDQQHGVSKAPANEVILGALGFERNISFGEQQVLNPLGINCLRYFPNRGFRVWGARTASSDSEFKYVNVRRYLIYLEHSIDSGSQWAVFENNGPALWARVKDSVDSFLFNEFKGGNLLGESSTEAFFVRCDRTTMTQNDLDNGRLVCLIGVALLKPAEFVIFRIGQKTADARG